MCGCNSNFKGGSRKSNFAANNCEDLISQGGMGLEGCTFVGVSPSGNCVFNCPDGEREIKAPTNKMPLRKSASLKRGKTNKGKSYASGTEKLMREHKARFSSFMGSLPKRQPVIDTKKHGISDEEYFAYNPKHRGNFSNFTDGRGFKHNNELNSFDF